MGAATEKRSDRINLRLQKSAKILLERAAGFEGKTVSNFILTCALDKAQKTIRQQEIMTLTAKNAERFLAALAEPLSFNEQLTDALAEHSERVTSK